LVPPVRAFSRWGVQLYTARASLGRDLPGTLKAIADIGYREVETAGYYGRSNADFRKALDDVGLVAPSAHIGIEQLQQNLPALLESCATIGHQWLVVPSLPGTFRSADGYKRAGEVMAAAASAAKPAGVRVAFHNHADEFRPVGDSNGMELMLAAAPRDALFVELDVYWIVNAGADPHAFLERHRGRVKMLHLKDSGGPPGHEMRDVGAGTIDWARVLGTAHRDGVEHVFTEHDRPADDLASLRASYAYLNRVGIPAGGRE
jgi:sugar phosphate isomerase/epimerase